MACLLLLGTAIYAQTPESLMADAKKQEQRYNDEEALKIYEQALRIAPKNVQVVAKCADVSMVLALRQPEAVIQLEQLQQSKKYADAAIAIDSTNAEANVITALVYSEMAKRQKKQQDVAASMQQMKTHADRALRMAPGSAKALHIAGRWHLDVLQLSGAKKVAISLLYGADTKEATVKEAISLMEQSKSADAYYTLNAYDLAAAYRLDKQYEKAIENLQQLQKLPARRQYDKEIKSAGASALQQLQ